MLKTEIALCPEKNIRIIKHKKETEFTTLYNDCINDEQLSANSLAVLVYVMSKPDDWDIRISNLRKRFAFGRDRVRGIIAELCTLGYMQKTLERSDSGSFNGYLLKASDKPIFWGEPEVLEAPSLSPETPLPAPALPATDLPAPAFQSPAPIYTKEILLQKKDIKKIKKDFSTEFDEFWSINPKQVDKQKAKEVFNRLLIEDYENFQKIMDGRRAQNVVIEFEGTQKKFIKGPTSWLREQRFNDEVQTREQLNEEARRNNRGRSSRSPERITQQFDVLTELEHAAMRRTEELKAELQRICEEEDNGSGDWD
jgi:hypothetical protein